MRELWERLRTTLWTKAKIEYVYLKPIVTSHAKNTCSFMGREKNKIALLVILFFAVMIGFTGMLKTFGFEEAYSLRADDDEIVVLESKSDAAEVVKDVVNTYAGDRTIKGISVDKEINVHKTMAHSDEIKTTDEAENKMVSESVPYKMTLTAEREEEKTVEAETEYVKDKDTYEDVEKVKQEGKDGSKIVTNSDTIVNGVVKDEKVVDEKVTKEAVTEIIKKGTKEMPEVYSNYSLTDQSDEVSGDDTYEGTAIARYACKYIGLPYVWGGNSLVTGADCGGFVCAVYEKFGYHITRDSYKTVGHQVTEPKAGDIVRYSGHLALYIGDGKIVNEMNHANDCCIASVGFSGKSYTFWRIVE